MTEIKKDLWNTVVAGRWNPAILTPKGISKLLFKKQDDSPFEVMVPLDAMGPPKVRIDGLLVAANFDRLVIDCVKSDWDSFESSRSYCQKAICELPKTPLSATGYNIRYEIKEPPLGFLDLLNLPLDTSISDQRLDIKKKETRRSIAWKDGFINLHIVKIDSETYSILLNFDRKSDDTENLLQWLGIPIDEIKHITKTIMCSVLKACNESEV